LNVEGRKNLFITESITNFMKVQVVQLLTDDVKRPGALHGGSILFCGIKLTVKLTNKKMRSI
jgi:hypothetical protein